MRRKKKKQFSSPKPSAQLQTTTADMTTSRPEDTKTVAQVCSDDCFLEIRADNIYQSALAQIRARSLSAFGLVLPDHVQLVGVESGLVSQSQTMTAVLVNGIHQIDIRVRGLIEEQKLICADDKSSIGTYGMQFFPYLSSLISIDIRVTQARLKTVSITLPDQYRVIWFKQELYCNQQKLQISHSHGEKESTYVYAIEPTPPAQEGDQLHGQLPVRVGGKELLRLVTLPTVYFFTSMLAVFSVFQNNKANLTFGVAIAALALMTKMYGSSNAPQFNTVLRDIYILFALTLGLWSFTLHFIPALAILPVILCLFLCWLIWFSGRCFNQTGKFPARVERLIHSLRASNEQKNRSA